RGGGKGGGGGVGRGGEDEAGAVGRRGRLVAWSCRQADVTTVVTAQLGVSSDARAIEIPNGIDTARFTPATREEQAARRCRLRLPIEGTGILFVGFFSRDKRPDLLCDAWIELSRRTSA